MPAGHDEYVQFDRDHGKTADAFGKDRTAMSVFSALLLTVNLTVFSAIIPANFHPNNSHNMLARGYLFLWIPSHWRTIPGPVAG